MNICVLGAGAWGTALTLHLARLGHRLTLVPRRIEHALKIASDKENQDYLPGYPLDDSIQIGCEIKPAIMEADIVILACPSSGLGDLCSKVQAALQSAWQVKMVISLCKGLEQDSLLKPAEVMHQHLPNMRIGVLSGPTFAGEVASGQPTAMVLASDKDDTLLAQVQAAFNSDSLRVYRTTDVIGVELGGCLKNVYAIGAGICDGLKLGDNAKASFITRALHEMVKLGTKLGGQAESFYGLSGFGDLIATCHGAWSRNRTFGEELVQASSADALLSNRKTVVEGYRATACFYELCQKEGLEAPLLEQIYAITHQGKEAKRAIQELMTRDIKTEH